MSGLLTAPGVVCAVPFVRGDVNADGNVNLTDATALLAYLFQGGGEPPCLAAADLNSSDDLDLSDSIYLLLHLFASGERPRAPFPECGEGGGSLSCLSFPACTPVDETVTLFAGGTLDELRALSPQLIFDHLIIQGELDIPMGSTVRLTVNRLTVGPGGGISRLRSPCGYLAGPNLSIRGREVVIDGDIYFRGVSGTRALDTADCNRCIGTAGGQLDIVADRIEIGSEIDLSGGTASTSVSTAVGGCSFGCSGGDGGRVRLEASVLDLTGSNIVAVGGNGGTGSCQGETSRGADGDPGSIELVASDILMNGGSVRTDGALVLRADRTEIYGALEGELDELIGGSQDDGAPAIEIRFPASGDTISLSEPLRIRVQLGDSGSGVRDLQVTGLGLDQTVSIAGVENGVFTLPPVQALPPAMLAITARDNSGHATTRSVDGLVFVGDLTIAQGRSISMADEWVLPTSSIEIHGEIVLQNGGDYAMRAGSFTLGETGRILLEEETDQPAGKAPSLSIDLSADATIAGTIDLTGRKGTPTTNEEQGGEDGGDLTCRATSIVATGSIVADGGDAVTREVFEDLFGRVRIAAPGGDAGTLVLEARDTVILSGVVSIEGGRSVNSGFGGCFDGGDGGDLLVRFAGDADFTGGVFKAEGGTQGGAFEYSCGAPLPGRPGSFDVTYTGTAAEPPVPLVEIDEREPNSTSINAHGIPFGATTVVWGSASPSDDAGERVFTVTTKGRDDQVEDFYLVNVTEGRQIIIALDPLDDNADLDLLLLDYASGEILAFSVQPGGVTEAITGFLPAGFYIVAVSWWDAGAGSGADYGLAFLPE